MIPLGDDYAYVKARNLECNGRQFSIDMYDITHPNCVRSSIDLKLQSSMYDSNSKWVEPIITAGTIHL